MTQVKDVMVRDVKVIDAGANLLVAAKTMEKNRIGSLVVVKKDEAIGIITGTDILYKAVAKELDLKKTKVEDIMRAKLITIEPEADLQEAAEAMTKYEIKKLPVIAEDGELVGIITATDLLKHSPDFADVLIHLELPPQQQRFGA